MSKKSAKRTRKILKWAQHHPEAWECICSPSPVTRQTLRSMVLALADEGLYELVLVLLTVHRNAPYLKGFNLNVVLREVVEDFRRYTAAPLADRALDWLASGV